jgi:hypothetical protein
MPYAVAIAMVISSAAAVTAAEIQASAARDAAEKQAAAAKEAGQLDAAAREKALGLQQPFLQIGQGATSNLSRLMGLSTTASGGSASPAPPGPTAGAWRSPAAPASGGPSRPAGPGVPLATPSTPTQVDPGERVSLASVGQRPVTAGSGSTNLATVGGMAPSAPRLQAPSAPTLPGAVSPGGMVTLRAPTGATRQFARGSAEHQFFLAQGAVEVG